MGTPGTGQSRRLTLRPPSKDPTCATGGGGSGGGLYGAIGVQGAFRENKASDKSLV